MPTFDLTTQPWIPVRAPDGGRALVSLGTALLNAREYACIEDASPLVTAALYRLLLAVLHRALEGPETAEATARWFTNGFPEDAIRAYLEAHRPRFDLFSEDAPFYQLAGLPLEGRTDHWTRLCAERGSGNTSFVFNEAKRVAKFTPDDAITPDEAARRLLEHQSFALGGLIKRFITSAVGAPVATSAVVIVQGENLHETLCLNLMPYPGALRAGDEPIWEQTPLTVADVQRGPSRAYRGLTDRYTWFSRSIRLEPEEEDGRTVVRFVAYDSGVKLEDDPKDPMVAYRQDKKDANRWFPVGLSADRALWRDFQSLVPKPREWSINTSRLVGNIRGAKVIENALDVLFEVHFNFSNPVTLAVFGLSNDQAKIQLFRAESFRLPAAVLANADVYGFVEARLEEADETGSWLKSAGRALAAKLLTLSDRQPHKDDVTRLAESLPHLTHYWATLEREFARLLSDARLVGQDAALEDEWKTTLARTASRAFEMAALCAGDDARALRAVESARRVLEKHLWQARFKREAA